MLFSIVLLSSAIASPNFAPNFKALHRQMQATVSPQPLFLSKGIWKQLTIAILVFILCSEQQQAHSEKIPRAPPNKDRVWRRNHTRPVPQRSADVGRRAAGRAAHHHVLHRQNRQVPYHQMHVHHESLCMWKWSLMPQKNDGYWWGNNSQVLTKPAETKTAFVCKDRPYK